MESSVVRVVRSARNMTKGGGQFGRSVNGRIFDEQIGEKVEATSLAIGSSVNGWSWRQKKFDGIHGVTENKASESGRQ